MLHRNFGIILLTIDFLDFLAYYMLMVLEEVLAYPRFFFSFHILDF